VVPQNLIRTNSLVVSIGWGSIGINTGEVVVRSVETGGKVEYALG
jgi:hypothetical protein